MQPSERPIHYLTCVAEINHQHEALFAMVESFCTNPDRRTDSRCVESFFASLVEQTRIHFQTEEDIMLAHQYPRLGIHRVAHARLLTQMTDIDRRARVGEDLNFEGFFEFLRVWLMDHINNEDRLLDDYLRLSQRWSETAVDTSSPE